MRVRYYVLSKDQQFEIYREGMLKGSHSIRARAIDAAQTMARLEARLAGTPSEVLVEDSGGQISRLAEYGDDSSVARPDHRAA